MRVKSHKRGKGQGVQNGHVYDDVRAIFRFSTACEAHFAPFVKGDRLQAKSGDGIYTIVSQMNREPRLDTSTAL